MWFTYKIDSNLTAMSRLILVEVLVDYDHTLGITFILQRVAIPPLALVNTS